MLYEYKELQNFGHENINEPLQRYLHKYSYHRRELKKLKTHEKDFLFHNMSILRNEKNKLGFDLSLIEEASEYYFHRLILTYFENLDLNKPTKNHLNGFISKEQMERDKVYFDEYYGRWVTQLNSKKGKYLSVIHIELNKRLNELKSIHESGKLEETEYTYLTKKHYVTAFFVYYKAKLFFDGLKDKFIKTNVLGQDIVINIYSFIHVLFRHYFPSLDTGFRDRSINDLLPFLDIKNLPNSIKDFISKYFDYNKAPLDSSREYILFTFKRDKYIIWIQYKALEELKGSYGFEFRTLYKCIEQRDLGKFVGIKEHPVDSELSLHF